MTYVNNANCIRWAARCKQKAARTMRATPMAKPAVLESDEKAHTKANRKVPTNSASTFWSSVYAKARGLYGGGAIADV